MSAAGAEPPGPGARRRGKRSAGRRTAVALGVALSLGLGAVSVRRPALVSHLDNRFYDALLGEGERDAAPPSTVVVAIDEEALARFGRWPWPRALTARLLERLAALGPRCVGVDVLFSEPEHAEGPSAGDRALAAALRAGPFVLGYEMTFLPWTAAPTRPLAPPVLHPLSLVQPSSARPSGPRADLWRPDGAVASLPEFARAAVGSGFFNAGVDPDGILRRVPLLMEYRGDVYPGLALAAALGPQRNGPAVLAPPPWGGRELRAGAMRVPLDDRGRLLIRFAGARGGPPTVSAAAVLEGRVAREAVAGRVAFLGATAAGLGEAVPTSVHPALAGVQVHAEAAEDLLHGKFARQTPPLADAALVVAAGIVATVTCIAAPPVAGAVLLGFGAAALWLGSTWLFHAKGFVLSPVLPIAALPLTFALLTLVRARRDRHLADRSSRELATTRNFLTESLASLAEVRHTETGAHILRTQRYLRLLCEAASDLPRFHDELDSDRIDLVAKLAPLHDIGKVGVPDCVLLKPERLTPSEFEQVKRHAALGRDALSRAETRAGAPDDDLLGVAKDIVYAHHERWDGTGYPEGLRGDRIPLAGRLMAIVDVYDALVTRRIYKDPVSHEEAVRTIVGGRGTQFDPDLVDAFLRIEGRCRQIARELSEPNEGAP